MTVLGPQGRLCYSPTFFEKEERQMTAFWGETNSEKKKSKGSKAGATAQWLRVRSSYGKGP